MVFSDVMGIYEDYFSTVIGTLTLTDDKLIFEGRRSYLRGLFAEATSMKIEIELKDITNVRKSQISGLNTFLIGIDVLKITANKEYVFTNMFKDLRTTKTHTLSQWVEEIDKAVKKIKPVTSIDNATQILKERYAKGEITKKQFEQMKKDLEN